MINTDAMSRRGVQSGLVISSQPIGKHLMSPILAQPHAMAPSLQFEPEVAVFGQPIPSRATQPSVGWRKTLIWHLPSQDRLR